MNGNCYKKNKHMKRFDIKILIGCEESDEVRSRFEQVGFDAWSCDIQPNRNPNAKHYQTDIFEILKKEWHVLIAFPPCTHLASSGASWFEQKRKDGRQQKGIDFFMGMINANVKHIAVENPIGIMSKIYRKPDQIIHPYYFGDKASKSTCLWLKNLPPLVHVKEINLFDNQITHVEPNFVLYNSKKNKNGKSKYFQGFQSIKKEERSKVRSKTFSGIANAMASQWSEYLIHLYKLK